jgi:Zn-dependent protease
MQAVSDACWVRRGGMLNLSPTELLQVVPAVLIGLTIHELGHAWVALKLGDDTPKLLGRVTLNPLKHIDILGFLLLVVAGFGWAKPVIINRNNLKHPFWDDVLIALSGPASNLLFAVVLVLVMRVLVASAAIRSSSLFAIVISTLFVFIAMNVSLGLFNLLPIPPLDGSHLLSNLLSLKSAEMAAVYFRYGSYLLIAIVVFERVTNRDILPIGTAVNAVVMALLGLVGLK